MKTPLTGMIVKLDFDGLHRSWQCQYCLVIADICDQNCMWSLFEHTHLPCLGGIGGRTEKMCRIWTASHLQQCLINLWAELLWGVTLAVSQDGRDWHEPWDLHQGPVCFLHGIFMDVLPWCSNACDPVTRKWLAPGSHWICMCFMSLFPPSLRMGAVLFLG